MAQLVTRLDDHIAAAIDELVTAGRYGSRSDVVRAGIAAVLEAERRRTLDERMRAAYAAQPDTAHELDESWRAAAAMIAEEPW